ncbi:unnamed protein product [Linum tenue]|uniref:Uncharacterized protein n=1 Tax=Linum tenue TaxID=586396 RepID=A0AAV0NB66_9ROSI|nr:unnamed protein product [Linum tenue]
MRMTPFELKSRNLFISSSDNATIDIYSLTTADDENAAISTDTSTVTSDDWNLVASAGPLARTYDSLKVFDKMIKGRPLRNLAEDLTQSHLLVNVEGLCFLDVTSYVNPILGFHYFRLQDLFLWSRHVAGENVTTTTVWNPRDIVYGNVAVDYAGQIADKDAELETLTRHVDDAEVQLVVTRGELDYYRKHYWGAAQPSQLAVADVGAIERRRRPLPSATFARGGDSGKLRVPSLDGKAVDDFVVIDDGDEGLVGPAPEFKVGWEAAKGGKFDTCDWWYVRTSDPDGGSTMVAYYDGGFDHVEFYNGKTGRKERVAVPCAVDGSFRATRHLRLATLSSLQLRVVFSYIPPIPVFEK